MKACVVKKILFLFLILSVTGVTRFAEAIPINSNIGLTPYKGQLIFRTQTRFTRKTDDTSGQNRKLDVFSLPFVGVYGITAKASVLVNVPFTFKDLRTSAGTHKGDEGVGDITVLGKYRVYTRNYTGATSRFSLLGGLELPTGDDNQTDSQGLLPQTLQLGSGSVDFIAGGAYTFQSLDQEWDADFRYKFNQEANNFRFGDQFIYNASYQKRFWPRVLPERGLYSQWNAVLEFNGVYAERNELGGQDVFSSGGHSLFLSPGIQFASQRMIFEFSYQHPILQELKGSQLKTDYKLALSLRYNFF
jgi:hypothetical protein